MKVTVSCPVVRSPRVLQIESMFDVAAAAESARTWDVTLPLDEKEWNIGLITGPSGSGKSTIARTLWPHVTERHEWDEDSSILDGFPASMPLKEISALLSSVGFGSVPSWLRPHRLLSTGEAARADLARALASDHDPVVVDEFTSVIDRQVAQVCSHAVAKTVRRRGQRFVAVSCHTDVEPWLRADWSYRTDTGIFTWGCVQPRPAVQLDIAPVPTQAWDYFQHHHYLTASLPGGKLGSWCAWVGETPVAFAFVARFPHAKVRDIAKIARIVTLPDWQGLGVAARMLEFLGAYYTERRNRVRITTLHPGLLGYLRASPYWRYTGRAQPALITGPKSGMKAKQTNPRGLQLGTYEYTAPNKPGSLPDGHEREPG